MSEYFDYERYISPLNQEIWQIKQMLTLICKELKIKHKEFKTVAPMELYEAVRDGWEIEEIVRDDGDFSSIKVSRDFVV